MKINSLVLNTDLIFAKFSGSIQHQSDKVIIKTPSNPGFHWGNFIIFNRAPKLGDCQKWIDLFNREFDYEKPHHYTFVWDLPEEDAEDCAEEVIEEFTQRKFEYESSIALSCQKLNPPKNYNHEITIKEISREPDWEQVVQLQILCGDEKYKNNDYETFKRNQFENYRQMVDEGLGNWYGAFIQDKLVGDLGIFHSQSLARYQSVETHPDFRRKGICGTLVYQASLKANHKNQINQFVMVADPDYHAARIYELVGFSFVEKIESFSWWKQDSSFLAP